MFLKPHAVPERIEVSHRARDFAGHGEFFPAVGVPAGPGRRRLGAIPVSCVRRPEERLLHNQMMRANEWYGSPRRSRCVDTRILRVRLRKEFS